MVIRTRTLMEVLRGTRGDDTDHGIKEIQMSTETVTFQSEGQMIAGVLHLPDVWSRACVIASHGLLSSKDSE